MAKTVEFSGGNASLDMRLDEVEHFSRQPAGDSHALDVVFVLDRDTHSKPSCACAPIDD